MQVYDVLSMYMTWKIHCGDVKFRKVHAYFHHEQQQQQQCNCVYSIDSSLLLTRLTRNFHIESILPVIPISQFATFIVSFLWDDFLSKPLLLLLTNYCVAPITITQATLRWLLFSFEFCVSYLVFYLYLILHRFRLVRSQCAWLGIPETENAPTLFPNNTLLPIWPVSASASLVHE